MTSSNNPSLDPADNESLVGSIRFAFKKLMQQVNGMLPAQVINYDRVNNRVQVQLLISLVTTNNTVIPRPQIASIPVLVLGGGNFFLSFPLNTGDLGWVLANDRDISAFLETYNQQPPNTARMFNFSDGVFIPDVMKGYTINSDDEESVVLSSIDGTTRIAVAKTGTINVTAPTVNINGAETISGIATFQAGAYLSGNIAIASSPPVSGTFTITP